MNDREEQEDSGYQGSGIGPRGTPKCRLCGEAHYTYLCRLYEAPPVEDDEARSMSAEDIQFRCKEAALQSRNTWKHNTWEHKVTDKELADKMVELGILYSWTGVLLPEFGENTFYWPEPRKHPELGIHADAIVQSWVVAGALLDQCDDASWNINIAKGKRYIGLEFLDADRGVGVHYESDADTPLARAIIEARVQALIGP